MSGGLKPEKDDLSVEDIRKFPGFENCPQEEAERIIQTLKVLCEITFTIYSKKKEQARDNLSSAA